MERFNQAAGAAGAPSAPAAPTDKFFTNGSPGVTPATVPGAWWFHMITEELRAVVVQAGLTPAHGTLTQVRDAILALIPPAGALVVRGAARVTSANSQAISSGVVTQFNPTWSTTFDTSPTSVSGPTLVVPPGLGITRAMLVGNVPVNAVPSGGIAGNIRKNSALIGAGAGGQTAGSSDALVLTTGMINCTAGDVFDISLFGATTGFTANNAAALYGNAFLAAIWF